MPEQIVSCKPGRARLNELLQMTLGKLRFPQGSQGLNLVQFESRMQMSAGNVPVFTASCRFQSEKLDGNLRERFSAFKTELEPKEVKFVESFLLVDKPVVVSDSSSLNSKKAAEHRCAEIIVDAAEKGRELHSTYSNLENSSSSKTVQSISSAVPNGSSSSIGCSTLNSMAPNVSSNRAPDSRSSSTSVPNTNFGSRQAVQHNLVDTQTAQHLGGRQAAQYFGGTQATQSASRGPGAVAVQNEIREVDMSDDAALQYDSCEEELEEYNVAPIGVCAPQASIDVSRPKTPSETISSQNAEFNAVGAPPGSHPVLSANTLETDVADGGANGVGASSRTDPVETNPAQTSRPPTPESSQTANLPEKIGELEFTYEEARDGWWFCFASLAGRQEACHSAGWFRNREDARQSAEAAEKQYRSRGGLGSVQPVSSIVTPFSDNPISELQEYLQKRGLLCPIYREQSFGDLKSVSVEFSVIGGNKKQFLDPSWFANKKQARKAAAVAALKYIHEWHNETGIQAKNKEAPSQSTKQTKGGNETRGGNVASDAVGMPATTSSNAVERSLNPSLSSITVRQTCNSTESTDADLHGVPSKRPRMIPLPVETRSQTSSAQSTPRLSQNPQVSIVNPVSQIGSNQMGASQLSLPGGVSISCVGAVNLSVNVNG